ncbi:MAG: DNA-binding protein [Bacteroidales bacterium]|nr:DNA-binding protein [Bacteroidales bacterium]
MATPKKSFIIRIDAKTLAAIEKWAADDFRSANGQIEWILSEALKKANRNPLCHTEEEKPNE